MWNVLWVMTEVTKLQPAKSLPEISSADLPFTILERNCPNFYPTRPNFCLQVIADRNRWSNQSDAPFYFFKYFLSSL